MACPHVTGTAALVWATGATSNAAVRDVLTGAAEDLGVVGRDPSFGYGLVDAQKATDTLTVQIRNPAEGATISGVVQIQATARGPNAIARMEFLLDTTSLGFGVKDADGWSLAWDATAFHNGPYRLVATAADALGQTASQSINVVVDNAAEKPPAPTAMHVAAIDMWATKVKRGYIVYTKVAVVDDSSPTPQTVPGATVSITTTLPSGRSVSRSAITSADGTMTLPVLSALKGTFTSTVTAVTGSLPYDPAANVETRESCSAP
jgi:hypothetical protein